MRTNAPLRDLRGNETIRDEAERLEPPCGSGPERHLEALVLGNPALRSFSI
jgi:hypothetical protein